MPEERRVVTVLFADVTGSTAMGEASDPEDVRVVLARYYAIARDVVAVHGGTLEKFIGDAVMAVFGIPQAHGDDAARALDAALALRDAAGRDPITAALSLRMGVNTGEVVASSEATSGDFLVTGDAVNVAARLQQSAEPGTILVGERTCRAAPGFRFGPFEALAAKGKSAPVVSATLVERIAERRGPRAPFLGRVNDLAQLELVTRRAFGERRPQLVTITAPAGTGKSRLVEEFVSRLGRPDVTVATAQCLPYGAAVTFLPLRGLAAGLLRLDRDADVGAAVAAAFGAAGYGDEDARRLAALIGTTLGDAAEGGHVDRDEVFSAWRVLVEALAARGPLIVVFEDLHWASDTLIDLVEHITVSRTAAPLVMVALARPELLDRRPSWGAGRRSFTAIALEPLQPEETRELVRVLTEGVPDGIATRIVERAGGNPFFAGELVRAYADRRRAGAADDEIVLPDTVHATVLARLDALPQVERDMLEQASVAGRTVRIDAIAALLGTKGRDEIAATLERLADRDLLVAQAADAYTFRHIVIREVAYATLPRAERVRAHLRLARWFDGEAPARGEELAELVAYHYRQAAALSPGGRLPADLSIERVVAAFERAARAAASAGAYAEPAEHLREAIRLAPPSDGARLNEVLGDLLQYGDAAEEGYRVAFERWRESGGDPGIGARLLAKRLVTVTRWQGSLTRPLEQAEFEPLFAEADALLARAPDPEITGRLAVARAIREGFYERDETTGRRLLATLEGARVGARERGDVDRESEILDGLHSIAAACFGDFALAESYTRARLDLSSGLALLERVDAWATLAWDLVYVGRYGDAIAAYHDARSALRPGEPMYPLSHTAMWATYAAWLCGRWDEAEALGDALVAWREEAPHNVRRFALLGFYAALRVAEARLDTSRLARLRHTYAAVADIAALAADTPVRLATLGVLNGEPGPFREIVGRGVGLPHLRGESMATLLLEHREDLDDGQLATAIRPHQSGMPIIAMRALLAHALRAGPAELRAAIAALDAADHVTDAARASALLALRTHEPADRADAEHRLGALGDRLTLQRLAEEW